MGAIEHLRAEQHYQFVQGIGHLIRARRFVARGFYINGQDVLPDLEVGLAEPLPNIGQLFAGGTAQCTKVVVNPRSQTLGQHPGKIRRKPRVSVGAPFGHLHNGMGDTG